MRACQRIFVDLTCVPGTVLVGKCLTGCIIESACYILIASNIILSTATVFFMSILTDSRLL